MSLVPGRHPLSVVEDLVPFSTLTPLQVSIYLDTPQDGDKQTFLKLV